MFKKDKGHKAIKKLMTQVLTLFIAFFMLTSCPIKLSFQSVLTQTDTSKKNIIADYFSNNFQSCSLNLALNHPVFNFKAPSLNVSLAFFLSFIILNFLFLLAYLSKIKSLYNGIEESLITNTPRYIRNNQFLI